MNEVAGPADVAEKAAPREAVTRPQTVSSPVLLPRDRGNAAPTIPKPRFVAPPLHTGQYASSSRLAGLRACRRIVAPISREEHRSALPHVRRRARIGSVLALLAARARAHRAAAELARVGELGRRPRRAACALWSRRRRRSAPAIRSWRAPLARAPYEEAGRAGGRGRPRIGIGGLVVARRRLAPGRGRAHPAGHAAGKATQLKKKARRGDL